MTNNNPNADYLANARLRFVVKKHHATRLHYDLRFEYWSSRGKFELASFALPDGPSLDPSCKPRAIRVADHDLQYMDSERVIPQGSYGAGPLMVWEKGRYRAWSGISGQPVDLETGLREGFVVIELEGEKLKGRFELRLVKKRYRPESQSHQEEWSFAKMQDDNAVIGSNIVGEQPNSVLTNRSLEEVNAGVPVRKKGDDMTGTLFA